MKLECSRASNCTLLFYIIHFFPAYCFHIVFKSLIQMSVISYIVLKFLLFSFQLFSIFNLSHEWQMNKNTRDFKFVFNSIGSTFGLDGVWIWYILCESWRSRLIMINCVGKIENKKIGGETQIKSDFWHIYVWRLYFLAWREDTVQARSHPHHSAIAAVNRNSSSGRG